MSSSFPPPPPPGEDPYAAPPPQGYPPAPGGYGSMPGQVPGAPAGPVTRPPAMDRAVLLMKVGAGLSLLQLIVTFASKSAIRDAVQKASDKRTPHLTATEIDAAVGFATVVGIISGLLGIALWLWMASANGKGKSWARIVATVFFGLSVLFFLSSFIQAGSAISKLIGLVSFLVGCAAIFFMYQKPSSDFYKASSGPRV